MSELQEKVNILIVDDKPQNLLALQAILDDPSYNLVTATSGPEALKHLLRKSFAVILLDVMMPEMDGFELASIIKQREQTRHTPIIFLTAVAYDNQFIHKGYAIGAVDYLQKPLEPSVVRAKVSVFVEVYLKTQRLVANTQMQRESDRRLQEQQIAELRHMNEERYRRLADAIPHVVWIANGQGDLIYLNARGLEYSGLLGKENINWYAFQSIIHFEDISHFLRDWHHSLSHSSNLEVELRLKRHTDGQFRWHLCRAVAEKDSSGQTVNWIGTFTDIDEQKKSEADLRVARQIADAANQAKSQFLANMSHEIRTPLGAIIGFTDLLFEQEPLSPQGFQSVKTIKRNGKHLTRLIDSILDLSKVESGQMEIENADFCLHDMLSEIKSSLEPQASAKGLYFNLQTHGFGPTTIVSSDQEKLHQILFNVVGNAVKFTEKGGITLNVEICEEPSRTKAGYHDLTCQVIDTGIGLSFEQSERLFQPFTQADKSTSRKYGGTGLGLALSKRFAKKLGGNLRLAKSELGKGSTFILSLAVKMNPVSMTPVLKPKDVVAHNIPDTATEPLSGRTILLVEDFPDNQVLFSRFLEVAGAKVEIAENGNMGVERAMAGNYDVVLMDIQMPGLDGYAATTSLRQKGYHKPIIALTAHVMKGEKERCLNAGYNDYLGKPIARDHLIDIVARYSEGTMHA